MKVLINKNNDSILSLDRNYILNNLSKYGALQLKNFQISPDWFSEFISKISSRVTNDPARKATIENAQIIESGNMKMGLHLENGNAPFVPDFQFFYCYKAPKSKSRTTYCDGAKAFKRLTPTTAKLLENRKIMYTRVIEKSKWQKYFSTEFQRPIHSLEQISDSLPEDTQIIAHENDKIEWRVRRFAVYEEQLSTLKVQAHCILAPSINYDIPKITWDDGSMINPFIINEISESCEAETHPMDFEDGDVVILNNHRFMHGREEILDPTRIIYGGQGYL